MTLDSSRATVKDLFLAAIDAEDQQQVERLLSRCDAITKAEVEKLLAAHVAGGENLLDQAVAHFGPPEDATIPEIAKSAGVLANGTAVGNFIIRESIGEGGMGTVYAAEQTEPVRRKVALKIIRAAIATNDVIARFEAERQAIALMEHPHIAKVLEAGKTTAGQPYLAMELVQGLPITKYADAHRLTTDERLQLFEKVCLAVRHAHHKGIIHRDLKPSNILVAHIDDAAVPKIIDFGLAKAIDRPLTDATVYTGFSRMLGTPMYMSPEQAELGVVDVDTRSDVYSLGVILYELLTGVPPFGRDHFRNAGFDEIRRIVHEVEPRRPSHAISTFNESIGSTIAQRRGMEATRLRAKLKGELDWIVLKALEKNRERRYDSAGDLARDIRRFLNNETVEACPPSTTYRLKKYVWKHRWPVVTVSTVFAALFAASAISFWQVIAVRKANQVIAAREQRTHDLLEAMRYREAIEHFRNGNLSELSLRLETWSQTTDYSPNANAPQPAGLMSLLNSAAKVPPSAMQHHRASIHDLASSADGQRVVSVDERGDVFLWNLRDTESSGIKLGSHGEPAHAVAMSPNGQQAVTGSQSGSLRFWDLQEQTLLQEIQPLDTGVETLQYSPDGKSIAAGARYSGVWVGGNDGNQRFRIENDHRHEALLFTPDGAELLVPTTGSRINVWNVATGKRQRSFDTGLQTNIRAMCFAGKDQRWLVVGNRFSESLVFIDRQSGTQAGQVVAATYPRALTASPDGLWIAASFSSGRIQLIQLSDRRDEMVTADIRYQFQAHNANEDRLPVQWLDSRYEFVSAGSDGRIVRWSRSHIPPLSRLLPKNQLSGALLRKGRAKPYFFYFDHLRSQLPQLNDDSNEFYFPEGCVSEEASRGLLAFGGLNQISIVSIATGSVIAKVPSPFDAPWWVVLSPDGQALFAGDESRIAVWETRDQWRTHELMCSLPFSSKYRPYFADGHRTLVLQDDEDEAFVELSINSGEMRTVYAGDASLSCLSHNERWLAIADERNIRVIDRKSGQLKVDFTSTSAPQCLRFFEDDKVLLSVDSDNAVRGWHMATGEILGALYSPNSLLGEPVFLQITEDGKRVLANYHSIRSRIPVILGRP